MMRDLLAPCPAAPDSRPIQSSPDAAGGEPGPAVADGRSIVLVGLMGAGKSAIGRRLAARLGLPFVDADAEIERAAGMSIRDIFASLGEPAFRAGERRVIARLLAGPQIVLATGGGAFMDPETRALVRARGRSIWLKVDLPILVRRVSGRNDRPLLAGGDPAAILAELAAKRYPVYAEADVIVHCRDEAPEQTTTRVLNALLAHRPPRTVRVPLSHNAYDVLIAPGLVRRAGAELAPLLPSRRAVIVADEAVWRLHGAVLEEGLAETGFSGRTLLVPPGEGAKSFPAFQDLVERMLAGGLDRRTAVIAFGGGVVGDLAGFAAAVALRGLPFVQVPTTLLAQVDSSVGGKTGINTAHGKNLVGAFHQPRAVLCDTALLATLPPRELRAGYAEVAKYGLIDDATFFAWCEANGRAVVAGDAEALAEAVARSVAAKARVVAADEREEAAEGGRALLNLGHTFAHAVEAEAGYDGKVLLHGEAVGLGMALAFRFSVRLGLCEAAEAERVTAHLAAVGLPVRLADTGRSWSAERLIARMRRDKKAAGGTLTFVLVRGVGRAFVARDVAEEAVRGFLLEEGATA
ncbi:3-dehydroquinate synthase [Elioraea thermophila]|uniref:3-dehydroquinate synthase n=1 Tax=Elioraea thermophila TaxID=2185104 RepID=UPI000DF11358|nr:3-dehydroquinate synthase [Elioraea thermophila]